MSNTLSVNLDLVKQFDKICFVLENCDVYEIDTADILDISFVATHFEHQYASKKEQHFRTKSGYVKLSPQAGKKLECRVERDTKRGIYRVDSEIPDYAFLERMQLCCDVCYFTLKSSTEEFYIHTPYDPLVDIKTSDELDYSNCPSYEIDNDGNLIFLFGDSSKQPTRKNNNYDELICGWKNVMGDYLPKKLKIKIHCFHYYEDEGECSLYLMLNVLRKGKTPIPLELIFADVHRIDLEYGSSVPSKCDVFMSKIPSGEIYVGFEGYFLRFFCKKITINGE